MNMNELGLCEGLRLALEELAPDIPYHFLEKTVLHVNRRKENLSAQVRSARGREALYLVPVLEWLLTEGAEGRGLVVLPTDQDVASAMGRLAALAEKAGVPLHAYGRDPDTADSTARLAMGSAAVLSARLEDTGLDLAGFGFVVVDGLSRFTEPPISGAL
ncbi:MAG TPA: hypothetical protein VLH39_05040, partial [Magnetospirillaceae bacterium]|nr:hypothetical protein [Magnetospirillaceae bacterium]